MQLLTTTTYLIYIYIINLLKRRRFEGICYVYISLVVLLSRITLGQKSKSNVKSIYFQKIMT